MSPPSTTTISPTHTARIATELNARDEQVRATAALLDEGATVPFIARYRKEVTGTLDEVQIATVRDRLEQLRELDKRRDAILTSLEERNLLTDHLRDGVNAADNMTDLEDLYLPYRPKRRTRATIARERGLDPLARIIWEQKTQTDPDAEAEGFVDPEKEVPDVESALAGARDVMAEWVSEDAVARQMMRTLYASKGSVKSQVVKDKEAEGARFRDYFDWEEPIRQAPSHRVLAILRGEREGVLSVRIAPEETLALEQLMPRVVVGAGRASDQVREAVEDGYQRLLAPSIETETRNALKERADETAIAVFAENLRNLLLESPLGEKAVLAIDPGFRTGCKVVCLDRQGKLIHTETVYLHLGEERTKTEAKKIADLAKKYKVEAIAIGNGTAGRETETVVRELGIGGWAQVVMVNESGASVYSASEAAREEFADQDITVRGAVSIGRRLMDPLAELVKIDPKSIGVGQYQHDVDQSALQARLDDVVESCVNSVGVDLNTASPHLLTRVSGLGLQLSHAIVHYRDENGPFASRDDLLNVPRLGPKAFEQAAGFLRIRDGDNPLDASAVHPESYPVVEAIAKSLGSSVPGLLREANVLTQLDLSQFVSDTVGLPTLNDIRAELARPGRDPRQQFEAFAFDDTVHEVGDLAQGQKLPGIVTNVTAFGAFVDVGVHQDGLVHISQLADRFVQDPNDVVKVNQRVTVTVLSIDLERNRIALSMRS